MEITIAGFPDYTIQENGVVTSYKKEIPLILQTSYGNKLMRYKKVPLFIKGDRKKYFPWVHRLVALHFVPNPDPKNRTSVNHLDNNPQNNHYTNLVWATPAQNSAHMIYCGRSCTGIKNGRSKLTDQNVRDIKVDLSLNLYTLKLIALKYGVTDTTISKIRNGVTWKHIY